MKLCFWLEKEAIFILTMNKVLSNKIYYATFILSMLVMLLHASYLELLDVNLPGYDFAYTVHRLFLVIGEAAVPTFFVISGYLLFTKYTLRGYPKLLLGKLFSLVIPYFIWSVLAFLFMQIAFPLMKGEAVSMTFKSVVIDILLSNEYPHLWFVRPLLVYFVCSPILYFAFKFLKKWSIIIPVALFFVYMFFRPQYGGILLWIPLFFVGSYLAYFKIPIMNPFRPRTMAIIPLVVLAVLAVVFTLNHTQYEDYAYYCYRFVSPLLMWLALDVLTTLFEKENIYLIFKTSGFIFFCHLFIVNAIKLLFELGIKADTNYNCALLFFLTYLLSIPVTLAFTYVMARFAKPVYRFLGGR